MHHHFWSAIQVCHMKCMLLSGINISGTGELNKSISHTFAEETFVISRFLVKFAKVCSREIFVIYKSRKKDF